MIITKRERVYREGVRKWLKHGRWDKELTYQTVKRTTISLFYIPILWWEVILKTDL